MKKEKKIYLTTEDYSKIEFKAKERGIVGRGWLSAFLSQLAHNEFLFVSDDVKKLIKMLSLDVRS